ncbi:MAG: hypothetical protein GY799_25690 [Desulfobulbaceae bacterium]|nr:hypothetical protein [Desulfobulbaceae bacterium]
MSKALNIRVEAKARIVTAAFADNVIRGKRSFNDDEIPAVCVYLSDKAVRASQDNKYAMDSQLNIEYHKSCVGLDIDEIDDQADAMILQVRAAMETDPRQFGTDASNRILTHPGIEYVSDEILYPDSAGNIVAVQVVYSVPHVESHGQ